MNICFYTSDRPTIASQLNISHLVHSLPGHNYSFLDVVSGPQPKAGLVDRMRRMYGEWKFNDGRFDYQRDLLAIDDRLRGQVKTINKKDFRTGLADSANDAKSEQFLKEIKPDIIIQAGAGILKPNTFTLASKATINLHHGISPEIRGIESTFWCMFYGIKEKIGVTCHLIDETLDTGAIVKQSTLNSPYLG
jgi:hypothetical protein